MKCFALQRTYCTTKFVYIWYRRLSRERFFIKSLIWIETFLFATPKSCQAFHKTFWKTKCNDYMFYNLSTTLFSSSTLKFFIFSRKIPNLTKIKVCTYLPHICDEERKINNTNQECLLNYKWEVGVGQFISTIIRHNQSFPAVLQNRCFAIFTGKHLCWSLYLIKLQAIRTATLLKRDSQQRCFPVKFAKLLRTIFLQNMSHRTCSVKLFLFLSPYSSDTFSKQEVVPSHENKW